MGSWGMGEWQNVIMGVCNSWNGTGPMSDGVGGAVLIDHKYRVHARVDPFLVWLGEGLPVRSDSQSEMEPE